MIINCASLGLDWETCSVAAYLEALEAWNELHAKDGDGKAAPEVSDELRRFMKAHTSS